MIQFLNRMTKAVIINKYEIKYKIFTYLLNRSQKVISEYIVYCNYIFQNICFLNP